MDQLSQAIAQYDWRYMTPYAQGAFQVTPQFGPWNAMYWMEGLPQQGYLGADVQIFVPMPYQKAIISHSVAPYYRVGQYAFGGAPTTGIYTGVEQDNC